MEINIRRVEGNGERIATWDQVRILGDSEPLNLVKRVSISVEAGDIVVCELEKYNADGSTVINRCAVTSSSFMDIVLNVIDIGNGNQTSFNAFRDRSVSKSNKGIPLELLE